MFTQYVFYVAVPSSGRMTEVGNSYSSVHCDTHLFVMSLVAILSYILSNCLRWRNELARQRYN